MIQAIDKPKLRTLPVPLCAADGSGDRALCDGKIGPKLSELRRLQAHHSFWHNPLLRACQAGHLSLNDLQFVFGQYSFYSRSFTRFLAGYMANTDNDAHRAQLVANLWEESGATDLNQRHAELFRRFLSQGLGVVVDELTPIAATQTFIHEMLSFCLRSPACESAALLSLGTEGIVPRLYKLFVHGLQKAGIAEQHLQFFHLHIACDDDHAMTLDQIMVSYADEPQWFEACRRAMNLALDWRDQFFTALYEQLRLRRLQPVLTGIQQRQSLAMSQHPLHYCAQQPQEFLYRHQCTGRQASIDFTVERLTVPSTVLDPRLVTIAPHKTNERHRHAHEAFFVIKRGQGIVQIDQLQIVVTAGDTVFVPRWAVHQVSNTGDRPLIILAITDSGLTQRAFIGNYFKTARMQAAQDADFARLTHSQGGDRHDTL